MPTSGPYGSLIYRFPDEVATVTFNDVEIPIADLIEVMVKADGWGYVLVLTALFDADDGRSVAGQGKTQVDGQHRNYTYWGKVAVTVP